MERMKELVKQLNIWSKEYYTLDRPSVSDAEFDKYYDELLILEKEMGIVLEDSPTQKVGGEILSHFERHSHIMPMYSLDKRQDKEGLIFWLNRITNNIKNLQNEDPSIPNPSFTIEYKFDGLAINLTYNEGKLIQAATRGTGVEGEGILPQVKTIDSIPKEIEYQDLIEVQAEALMRLSTLERYNEIHEEKLSNARNAAAGALRNLDTSITRERRLIAFFYGVQGENLPFKKQMEIFEFLEKNKFPIHSYHKLILDEKDLIKEIDKMGEERHNLDFLIDGLVIKLNDLRTRELLGHTAKFPRWALAYKFEAEVVETILKDIIWNVGRTGKITPIAILEPVEIDGVIVRRATLNNYEDMERKAVRIGAPVMIRRSNDVIPEILETLETENETFVPEKLKLCPSCGSELVQEGVHQFCLNSLSCEPQLVLALAHFASKPAMDIEGLSEKTAELLLRELNIREIADLYDLTIEDLLTLPGFKDKRANNLYNAIVKSKNPNLTQFLVGLGIPNVGTATARDLANKFKNIDSLTKANKEELLEVDDIGEITADEILSFFNDELIKESLRRLEENGVKILEEKEIVDNNLEGLNIVLTGRLSMVRRELEEMLRDRGANIRSSVSNNTDIVIAGEEAGSKRDRAEELNIKIIGEEDIPALLAGERLV